MPVLARTLADAAGLGVGRRRHHRHGEAARSRARSSLLRRRAAAPPSALRPPSSASAPASSQGPSSRSGEGTFPSRGASVSSGRHRAALGASPLQGSRTDERRIHSWSGATITRTVRVHHVWASLQTSPSPSPPPSSCRGPPPQSPTRLLRRSRRLRSSTTSSSPRPAWPRPKPRWADHRLGWYDSRLGDRRSLSTGDDLGHRAAVRVARRDRDRAADAGQPRRGHQVRQGRRALPQPRAATAARLLAVSGRPRGGHARRGSTTTAGGASPSSTPTARPAPSAG